MMKELEDYFVQYGANPQDESTLLNNVFEAEENLEPKLGCL